MAKYCRCCMSGRNTVLMTQKHVISDLLLRRAVVHERGGHGLTNQRLSARRQ